jgi:hypothetical protein
MMTLTHQKTGPKDAAKQIDVYCAHFITESQLSYKKLSSKIMIDGASLGIKSIVYSVNHYAKLTKQL